LESKGIDVILGMGWLSKHKVLINCAEKYVKLTTPEGKEMEFIAEPVVTAKGVTNHAKVNQLVLASATTFITYHGVATAPSVAAATTAVVSSAATTRILAAAAPTATLAA
jgi:hypothetical protein